MAEEEGFHWYEGGYFWAVNLPGLTREQAEKLLVMAERAGMSFGGSTVNPSEFLTLHLDRASVEILFEALGAAQDARKPSEPADAHALASLRDELRQWLEVTPFE
jgi:hypothetical protein